MSEQKKNGIPQMGPDTGNYWCTWDTQFRVNSVEDGKDTKNLRNVLTQDFLFAEDGMLRNYLKNVRQDLYVLLDDGWDVGRMCQETEQSAYLAVWFWILINFRILPENHGNVLQSFVAS